MDRPIDSAKEATALARSIIADARTYGGPSPSLDEARALFRERVAPEHHAVFEQVASAPPQAQSKVPLLRLLVPGAFAGIIGFSVWLHFGGEDVHTFADVHVGSRLTAAVAVPEGTLTFLAAADRLDVEARNAVLVDVTGRQGSRQVATLACPIASFIHGTTESGGSWTNADCRLGVPAGGIDTLVIETRLENPAVATSFQNLRIRVVRH